MTRIRPQARLGKYRIERRLGVGGFATVYRAYDTIEGIRVALKVPHAELVGQGLLDDFRKEVRVTAQLDHPNIVNLKNATFIDEHFVIVYPLADGTLEDRLARRLATRTAFDYWLQMLEGLAYAHDRRVIHCDIKPDNVALFSEGRLRLMDFGIARVAQHTVSAPSGTLGYMAPEQGLGRASFRSDVFSLGLVVYRMFTGVVPEWPFEWPGPRHERLRGKLAPAAIDLLRRALDPDPRGRFETAEHFRRACARLGARALATTPVRRRRRRPAEPSWNDVRWREFLRQYRRELEIRHTCSRCEGPVAETMQHCPWCGVERKKHNDETRFPRRCPRCRRGLKKDWRFCPWCYGPSLGEETDREYADRRYDGRCTAPRCTRKVLMPFMRYCPWCRGKVRKRWPLAESRDRCGSCGWGVAKRFWEHCPWCGKSLGTRARR